MNYILIKQVIELVQQFEVESNISKSRNGVEDFKRWIVDNYNSNASNNEPNWEGKENGRSPESVINTFIVHLNRYAKGYSKSAIFGSDFSSQEDFIYLINLKAFGEMTKMDLIKKNVHEKPAGMQIIGRLIAQGWINQTASEVDKRSKVLKITKKGIKVLETQMSKIRKATKIVTGNLTHNEKMELIRLLTKLNDFHRPIYDKNIEPEYLLEEALKDKKR
ncbi:MarR family winged helix-turn-helix transcriptional regulator [Ferruginibacter albus]|uniref:MarR family winged helix-turn-helix transcriptional regulator n=1 Tax=Ferruginibacter albus TaxID=2875540 RepID=UPI001CC73EC9|nr:MarR family winged helix-turn-helix transcriptional regulator [Ferruginibacter albus]UAY51247.1 MarR family winged helix-turn-helix transcriptional regulator [Ferruginibacter albus]